jgi:hypothetical protein
MGDVIIRVLVGIVFCVILPTIGIKLIIQYMEITWWNIFMVSGMESLWVYLCWDISKWIIQAWRDK